MTNTVEEIASYCREENTFGALLLTGEWGSGKTYLLEHDLPKCLGDTCTLLRVSLFGETSVDMVRQKIKKTYFNKVLEEIGRFTAASGKEEDSAAIPIEPSNAWITRGGTLSGIERIFAQNPSEYIRLESTILGRTVILIFDDLERCHLSQAEVLGCINEYCENLHMKTIIVANEEKIQTNSSRSREEGRKDFLAYSEIKEKIIARTVTLAADYPAIIGNVISNYRTRTKGYVDFLRYAESHAVSLIQDCEIKNIRSLRCGFQDFENIFVLCKEEDLSDKEILKYFTSFVLFEILAKGGRISKSNNFGYGLNRLHQKYPTHYTERCVPLCVKEWVMSGGFDPDATRAEIRRNAEMLDKNALPQSRLRSMTLLEMDDDTVERGWKAYLEMAYTGQLTLDEYALLLQNMISAREYHYNWPAEPDMVQVDAGLVLTCRAICESDHADARLHNRLEEAAVKKLLPEEYAVYTHIVRFVDGKAYLYGLNRNRILAALRSGSERALYDCRSYDTDRLDSEMVEAIVEGYRNLDGNQHRMNFIDTITRILTTIRNRRRTDDTATDAAFADLKTQIQALRDEESDRPLNTLTTDFFLQKL